jgi:hypothetical protein
MLGYWPGSAVHQRATLATPRWEDFEYSSYDEDEEDSLAWMGNGMIMAQTEGRSTTTYLDHADIPPVPGLSPASSSPSSQATTPYSLVEDAQVVGIKEGIERVLI